MNGVVSLRAKHFAGLQKAMGKKNLIYVTSVHAEIADRKVLVDCAEDVLVVGEWDGGRETCLADIHNAREKRMKSWRISSYRPVVFFSLTDL